MVTLWYKTVCWLIASHLLFSVLFVQFWDWNKLFILNYTGVVKSFFKSQDSNCQVSIQCITVQKQVPSYYMLHSEMLLTEYVFFLCKEECFTEVFAYSPNSIPWLQSSEYCWNINMHLWNVIKQKLMSAGLKETTSFCLFSNNFLQLWISCMLTL